MARIPEAEIERLKGEVSVARLIEASGIALAKRGKDLVGPCPFHAEAEPSLVVTPAKNLYHCFGCGAAGGPIDWVMKRNGVSFRHAVELLREGLPMVGTDAAGALKRSTVRALPAPVTRDADDQAMLNQVVGFYHQTLKQSPEALAYLTARGLAHPELVDRFKLGYANRTLGLRLPEKNRKAGAELRTRLERIGIYRESGHEHFNGSLVVPVIDDAGDVTELYGRKVRDDLRPGTPLHLYLPGPHRGVWNLAGIAASGGEIIVAEALIDALTFWCAGHQNVTAAYGVEGLTDDHLTAFRQHAIRRALIAFDRDEPGERGAAKVAERLSAIGVACFRIAFPKGMDANEYALKVTPASKSLGVLIRKALWLGTGPAPDAESATEIDLSDESPKDSPLAAQRAAKEEAPSESALESTPDALPARAIGESPEPDVEAVQTEREITVVLGDRRWRVRGLAKNSSYDALRVNVLVSNPHGLHVDTFDLYAAKARQAFARAAAAELDVEEPAVQRDLGKLLLKLEAMQDALIQAMLKPKAPSPIAIAQADQEAALALLRDPDLAARIVADFDRTGLVGEPTNALVGYLAAVSRKLATPLAIIVQSSSAAGKSALMDAVLALVPEEERQHYSAMTGQSLFYLGEKDLKHKILAIAEEEGVRQAAYALKLLQSQGELTIASTGKDPETGLLVTQEYRVEGPVMLFLTTTAIDLDEELVNRCLVLSIDESREQTRAIQQRQRARRTLAGLVAASEADAVTALHRNAQRLLKPLAVVNPYADRLGFVSERTRTRRDHQKYLTLIDAIALLHQHQRPVKRIEHRGRTIEYVEVTAADIALANRLAHDVLGRSLDELPPQSRRVLAMLCGLVAERCQAHALERAEVRFTRREARERSGLSNGQLGVHLGRLLDMEYLVAHRAGRGNGLVYELLFDGAADDELPHLPGLIDVENAATTGERTGSESTRMGSVRPPFGPGSGAVRTPGNSENPSPDAGLAAIEPPADQTARRRRNGAGHAVGVPSLPLAAS